MTDSFLKDQKIYPYSAKEIRNALGKTVRFQKKRERHYIDEREKDALLHGLMDFFIKSLLNHLSHPDFSGKYVLKELKVHLKRQTWYQDDHHG